jgi:hypothetical protein
MRSSKAPTTARHIGTTMVFAEVSNINGTVGGITATEADQSSSVNFSKQPVRVADDAFASDDWGSGGEDGDFDSKYDVPLENMMTHTEEEKGDMKEDITSGVAI